MEKNINYQVLEELEEHVNTLLGDYKRLVQENNLLRQQQEVILNEKADLLEKNCLIQNKIKSMVNQLKALEKSA